MTLTFPRYRGVLHLWGFAAMLPLSVSLFLLAGSQMAEAGVSVYVLGVAAMFGVSALYHRGPWRPKVKRVMQRLDHSTIFLAIAGTYTPLALLGLGGSTRVRMLVLVWALAVVGIVLQWLPVPPPRVLSAVIYAGVGWAAVFALPQFVHGIGWWAFSLVLLGGLAYTTGSVVYAVKRPNPSPAVFGFHEVFHSCTLVAAAAHFAAIALVVARS